MQFWKADRAPSLPFGVEVIKVWCFPHLQFCSCVQLLISQETERYWRWNPPGLRVVFSRSPKSYPFHMLSLLLEEMHKPRQPFICLLFPLFQILETGLAVWATGTNWALILFERGIDVSKLSCSVSCLTSGHLFRELDILGSWCVDVHSDMRSGWDAYPLASSAKMGLSDLCFLIGASRRYCHLCDHFIYLRYMFSFPSFSSFLRAENFHSICGNYRDREKAPH